jgi:methyl-accepting chemotaxis protein
MLNDLRDILETLQWKRTWLGILGVASIVLTLFLANIVMNIGTSTSYFGDQFGVRKLFVITSNKNNGKGFKLRKTPDISSKSYSKERAEIDDVYLYKGEAKSDYVKIDPVSLKIYREGLGLSSASSNIIEERNSFFIKDSSGGYEGYVINRAGKIFTPFEYNVKRFLEKNDIVDGSNYKLGPVLQFFTVRAHVKYIYGFMAALLFVFLGFFLKRLWFLFDSYTNQDQINKNILFNDNLNARTLNALIEKKHYDVPHNFIKTLHNSFKIEGSKSQFNNIYNDFISDAEQRDEISDSNLRKCNVWIIRAGIFGTLVGLIVAFLELYVGMGFLDSENFTISQEFIEQLQAALLGNSMAIATSITAHGASLLMEVFLSSFISGQSNKQWIEKAYLEMITLKYYKPKIKNVSEGITKVNTMVDDMSNDFEDISFSLKDFSNSANSSKNLINTMNSSLTKINEGLSAINKDLVQTQHFANSFKETSSLIYNKTDETKNLINEASFGIEKVRKQSAELSRYLEQKMNQIKISASDTIDRSHNFIKMISKKLEALKDKIED